jgi:uncharacterized membrane protein
MNDLEPRSDKAVERVVLFSDAVFAIAITLLVLEVKVPDIEQHTETALAHALLHLAPKLIGFVASFLIVGVMWIEHHRIFRHIAACDGGLLWRNLLLLLTVSFVPFPTALFSEYYWSRSAFILYTASFGAVALTKLWVWRYASRQGGLLEESTDQLTVKRISRRSLAVPLACAAAVALSMISVLVAPIGFALIPLLARLLDPSKAAGKAHEIEETAA